MRAHHLLLLTLATAVVACTGADTDFVQPTDGGADAPIDTSTDGGGFLLIVPDTDVTLGEGEVGSFTVSLSAAPPAPITVSITAADAERISVPSQITIDDDNWSVAQSISVTALADDDAAPNDVAITVAAPGAADDVQVTAHVTDDDTLAIHTVVDSIEVTEGLQGTVKVRLTAAPSGDTMVAVALDPLLTSIATVSPPTLTFTAATWHDEQDVVITAEQDLDVAGATAVLRLTTADSSAVPAAVDVTIFDDDQVGISPSPSALGTITEGGPSTGLGISLTRDPGGPIRVTVTPELTGKVTLNPAFVDFDSSNWMTVQSIQVAGAQDDDTRDDTLDLLLAAPALDTRRVSVTVDDDDSATLETSASQVTVLEGNTVMIGVRLAFDPLGTVAVTAGIDNPTVATVTAGASLSFDSTNYHTYQQVTIRADHDTDLVADDTFINLQATALGAMMTVPLHKNDDDQQVIETSTTTVSLLETGMTTFDVRLRYRPDGMVTVNAGTGGNTHASVVPTSLSFNPGTYNTWQTVTVTGSHDVDLIANPVPITLSGATAPATVTVTATVNDADTQIIQPSTSSLTVSEGAMGTFTVRLGYQPAGMVRVTLTSNSTAVATVSPAMIDFDAGTYATPVTVTVTGAEDPNAAVDTTSVVLRSTGLADRTVSITANDNDVQGLETSAASISVMEGTTAMLGVRLRQDPVGAVTVNASSLDAGVVGVTNTTQFTFDSTNYMTYQYTTVDALQDPDLIAQTATVRFASVTPALSTDVAVTKPDDDSQVIETSVGSVTALEGGTAQFGVRLRYEPAGSVTVQVASADSGKATTSGNLTFGPGDYTGFQMVTVTGTPDDNLVAETVAINLTSPGNAPLKAVTATINDDDTQVIQGAPASINLTEGQQTTMNIRLKFQPSTPTVTVTVGASPSGVVTTSGNLTFTNGNWATTQPVTVTATQDVDLVPGSTTLSLTGAGATAVTVPIGVTDDDTLSIVPSPTTLSVSETNTTSFTVALSNQPAADTTVTLALSPLGVATLSRSTITFTTSNWNTAIPVTVTPVGDPDNASESTTVTLSAGTTSNATVGITVNDNTVVSKPGWPTSFLPTTSSFSGTTLWAYKITTTGTSSWTLDSLSLITGSAGNNTRMALYSDNTDKPGTLMGGSVSTAVVAGENTLSVTAPALSPGTVYWIVLAVSGSVPVGDGGLANQGRRCQKTILAYTDPWPSTFGTSTCSTTNSINVFATMHQ